MKFRIIGVLASAAFLAWMFDIKIPTVLSIVSILLSVAALLRTEKGSVDVAFDGSCSYRYDKDGQLVETRFNQRLADGHWLTTVWKADDSMFAEYFYTNAAMKTRGKEHEINRSAVFGDLYPKEGTYTTDIRGSIVKDK